MYRLALLTSALIALALVMAAAIAWIRRRWYRMRGKPLPLPRIW